MNDLSRIFIFIPEDAAYAAHDGYSSFVGFPNLGVALELDEQVIQDTKITIAFSVPIDDPRFVNGTQTVSYAYGGSNGKYKYHGPSQRGSYNLNFFSDASTMQSLYSAADLYAVENRLRTLTLHGVLLAISFCFIFPMGIFVARYHSNISKWVDIHQTLMSLVASNVLSPNLKTKGRYYRFNGTRYECICARPQNPHDSRPDYNGHSPLDHGRWIPLLQDTLPSQIRMAYHTHSNISQGRWIRDLYTWRRECLLWCSRFGDFTWPRHHT